MNRDPPPSVPRRRSCSGHGHPFEEVVCVSCVWCRPGLAELRVVSGCAGPGPRCEGLRRPEVLGLPCDCRQGQRQGRPRQRRLESTAGEIHEWIVDPAGMTAKHKAARKPAMPAKYASAPEEEDLDALVAYLSSLKK